MSEVPLYQAAEDMGGFWFGAPASLEQVKPVFVCFWGALQRPGASLLFESVQLCTVPFQVAGS